MNFERYDHLQAALGSVGDSFRYAIKDRLPNPDPQAEIIIEEVQASLNALAGYISEALQATINE